MKRLIKNLLLGSPTALLWGTAVARALAATPLAQNRRLIGAQCWMAHKLSLAGKPRQAREIADRLLASEQDDLIYLTLAPIYYLQGQFEKALETMRKGETKRHATASARQLDKLGLRIFSTRSFARMGHAGLIDIFLKGQILGILEEKRNILLGDPAGFANPAFMDYLGRYCEQISDPTTMANLFAFCHPIEECLALIKCADGRLMHLVEFGREVQLQWEAENRPALLSLSDAHRSQGRAFLAEFGMPEDAWFCGLHARQDASDQMRALRNSDITSYDAAIDEIIARGGWVVRMGDRSMPPVRPRPGLIDYAHCDRRQDWIDVFLWAEGRFFIGTGSGPNVLPICFGKPTLNANWGPMASRHWGKTDLLLPKLYWLAAENRPLTMEERMSPTFGYHESLSALEELGVTVIDNSPEELREAVIEMIELENGGEETNPLYIHAQAYFNAVSDRYSLYPSRIARAFIDRNPQAFG